MEPAPCLQGPLNRSAALPLICLYKQVVNLCVLNAEQPESQPAL